MYTQLNATVVIWQGNGKSSASVCRSYYSASNFCYFCYYFATYSNLD